MVKKLLNKVFQIFSYNYDKKQIEKYLGQSNNLADLENRMKKLDQQGAYNKFYI